VLGVPARAPASRATATSGSRRQRAGATPCPSRSARRWCAVPGSLSAPVVRRARFTQRAGGAPCPSRSARRWCAVRGGPACVG